MLDDFRRIDIVWEKATDEIYESIRVMSSDETGRKLIVQVLDDGLPIKSKKLELELYWEAGNAKNNGLDYFELIDEDNSIFELYFTTGLLSNIGRLKSNLLLRDEKGVITSNTFYIEVSKGVDWSAVESSNSFSRLTKIIDKIEYMVLEEEERVKVEAQRIKNEELRVEAEKERDASEDLRNSYEDERIQSEKDRDASEANRISQETLRDEAETERATEETVRRTSEDDRIESENNRVDAEEERALKEQERRNSENQRAESESLRVGSEGKRSSNEEIRVESEILRDGSEQERASAELNRASKEDIRIEAENSRATNESLRVESEQDRIIKENKRADAEKNRKLAENDRAQAEDVRSLSEIAREQKESRRQEEEALRDEAEQSREVFETERKNFLASLKEDLKNGKLDGEDLEYQWRGTELGIKKENDQDYIYVDLEGPTGSIENLAEENIESALGFLPKDFKAGKGITIGSDDSISANLEELATIKTSSIEPDLPIGGQWHKEVEL